MLALKYASVILTAIICPKGLGDFQVISSIARGRRTYRVQRTQTEQPDSTIYALALSSTNICFHESHDEY